MIVTGVGTCVAAELADTVNGLPDRICLVVPGAIAWDKCDCGQLAQTITGVGPTEQFPTPYTGDFTNGCGPEMAVVSVSLSLTRCMPGITRQNEPPSCDTLLATAIGHEEDRAAVRRSIACCLRTYHRAYRIYNWTVGAATTAGPEGGCIGIDISYQFSIPNTCC
jgi:hypothetical protein